MRLNVAGLLLLSLSAAALSAACGNSGPNKGSNGGDEYPPPGFNDTGSGAGTGTQTGLPCNVQAVLEARCISCHRQGSPAPLLTYEDVTRPSPSDPSKTMAQAAVERMKSTDATKRMPPPPAEPATFNEAGAINGWVQAGTPRGTASCTPPTGGTGGGDFNTPTVCTSNKTWTSGNTKSSFMRPGGACITCHSAKGGPAFTVAGTVYPTAHEPNDCNGKDGAGTLTVTLTDVNGGVIVMNVNSAGNFYTEEELFPPVQVAVSDGTRFRSMGAPLTSGDCNTCHTEKGANGAPGRILAP